MELIDIVNKLVGRIEPIGDTAVDKERYQQRGRQNKGRGTHHIFITGGNTIID